MTDLFNDECHICGGRDFSLCLKEFKFPFITSDCRPWSGSVELRQCSACGGITKRPSDDWKVGVSAIYASYQPYYQAEGTEQKLRDGASFRPRSAVLVDHIRQTVDLPEQGTALDIGTGNGVFLRSFADRFPNWDLAGNDLGGHFRSVIEGISERARFIAGRIEDIPGCFDLISMVHMLEHAFEPRTFLAQVARMLSDRGLCFVQVPNLASNPFDLVIYDHATHFTPSRLRQIAAHAFAGAIWLETDWNPKEISLLGGPGVGKAAAEPRPDDQPSDDQLSTLIGWLNGVVEQARAARHSGRPFGVFGTSIAGTWLGAALEGDFDFFVDEDEARVGRHHMERPICRPGEAHEGSLVLVPFPPKIAQEIAQRFSPLPFECIIPGPIVPAGSG